MATFSDLATIARDPNFQSRVGYAMAVAAVNVAAEASNTTNHGERLEFSVKVINGSYSPLFASLAVLTNSTIAAEAVLATTPGFAIPDSDIQFAVNSLWTSFSGGS